jgi:O-antigen ligase
LLLSRGAFIAMTVSVALFMLIYFKRNYVSKAIILVSIILISSISVQNIFLTENKNQIIDRVSSISIDRSDDSVNERLSYYSHALESIKKNPILGIGIGNWKIKSIEYAGRSMKAYIIPYHVHNDFLQIGAEIGLIGLIFYIFLVIYPILICINQILKKEHNDFHIIVLLVLISYFIDSMLNFPMSRSITHMQLIFTIILFNHIHKSTKHK